MGRWTEFQKAAIEKIATPYAVEQDSLAYWRARILFAMLVAGLVMGTLTIAASLGVYIQEKAWLLAVIIGLCYAVTLLILFSARMRYEARAGLALLMCYAIGLAVILSVGPLSGGPAWLFAFAVLVGVLLGFKPALAAIALNAVSLAVMAGLVSAGWVNPDFPFFRTPQVMMASGVNFIFLNALAVVSVATLVKGLVTTRTKEIQLSAELLQEQKALNESVEKYKGFIENAPMGIYTMNLDGEFTYGNKKIYAITGYRAEDWLHKPFQPIIYPADLDVAQDRLQKRLDGLGSSEPYEIRVFHASGEILWVRITSESIFDEDADGSKKMVGVQSFVTDITQRKLAEEALNRSEGQNRLILEQVNAIVWAVDTEMRVTSSRGGGLAKLGLQPDQAVGETLYSFLGTTDDRVPSIAALTKALNGQSATYEESCGGFDWVGHADPLRNEKGEIIGSVVVSLDITERKQAQTALKESEARFRTLVEKSPLGIALIGDGGVYIYVNPSFEDMFGYTLADVPNGRDWFQAAFPDEALRREAVQTWIEDKQQAVPDQARLREFTVTCKDGTRKEINFRPVTMENSDQFVIYEDITESLRLQQQLQQAQKFEAIATLAGGIAHDFNNLLMGIQGRASLLAFDLPKSNPLAEHIRAIEENVRSATGLTRQILGFARGGKYRIKSIAVNELMLDSVEMFGRTKKEIRIQTKLEDPSPVVAADRIQLEQVLLNLFVNAWQAMPDGGALYLQTRVVKLDARYCKPYEIAPGDYTRISVTDTGIGMDAQVKKRIFDPFFTTKEKTRGTGLGLASAYGIIKNHGGMITVYSEPGHGTTFNIYLPAAISGTPEAAEPEKQVYRGSETILLVDDEEMILDVGREMLTRLGYRILVANDGEQAIEAVLQRTTGIDLVILDMIMPGIDGGQTFDRIREIRPELPVVLSSGYSINGQATKILERGCKGFIQKPFSLFDISKTIRKVLDGARSAE